MIIDNTQPRLYVCAFQSEKGEKGIAKIILNPGLNTINNDLIKDLFKHPGFKSRIDAGILKTIDSPKPLEKPKIEKNKIKENKPKDK